MAYPIGHNGSYFKICLIGDGGVGKTSLRNGYLEQGFQTDYIPTIGSGFASKQVTLYNGSESKEIRFQIWDLTGQQRFDVVRAIYYRDSHGAILVFDQTRPEPFSNFENWKKEMFTHVGRKIPFIVLGNKSDLESGIDQAALREFIEKSEREFSFIKTPFVIPYLDTSARTSHNVEEAFTALTYTLRNFILATETNSET